jgi:hypothetical protein
VYFVKVNEDRRHRYAVAPSFARTSQQQFYSACVVERFVWGSCNRKVNLWEILIFYAGKWNQSERC